MLSSISPLGERARASRWWLTTTAYVVSSLLGGLALGLLAALVGGLVPAAWRVVAGGVPASWRVALRRRAAARPRGRRPRAAALLAAAGRRGLAGPLPRLGRRRRASVPSSASALVTIITSATTYAVACSCAAVRRRLAVGLLVGGVFGLVRALPVLAAARRHGRGPLRRLLAGVERARRRPSASRWARLLPRPRWSSSRWSSDGAACCEVLEQVRAAPSEVPARLGGPRSTGVRAGPHPAATLSAPRAAPVAPAPLPADGATSAAASSSCWAARTSSSPCSSSAPTSPTRACSRSRACHGCGPPSSARTGCRTCIAGRQRRASTSSATAAGPSACSSCVGSHGRRMATVPRAEVALRGLTIRPAMTRTIDGGLT